MKIMLDTNVLISSLIFGGTPKQLIERLLLMGHDIYISDYIENEILDKIHLKWPQKEDDLRKVYQKMNFIHCPSTEEKLGEVSKYNQTAYAGDFSDQLYKDCVT